MNYFLFLFGLGSILFTVNSSPTRTAVFFLAFYVFHGRIMYMMMYTVCFWSGNQLRSYMHFGNQQVQELQNQVLIVFIQHFKL